MWSCIAVAGFWPRCQRSVGSEAPSPAPRQAADLFPCLPSRDPFVVVAVPRVWALGSSLTFDIGSVSAEPKL